MKSGTPFEGNADGIDQAARTLDHARQRIAVTQFARDGLGDDRAEPLKSITFSRPSAKVPEAGITGLRSVSPPTRTERSTLVSTFTAAPP